MRRLERFLWQGKPLLHEIRRDSGLHAWTPSPRLLGMEHMPQETHQAGSTPASPAFVAAGREAVIAHSRATYARPRDEVEREMALANGWEWPPRTLGERQDELRQKAQEATMPLSQPQAQAEEPSLPTPHSSPMSTPANHVPAATDPQVDLRRDLAAWGVPADLIARLLADHDPAKIRRQLDWLPLRNAHDPARFLVAAIQKDYAPPVSVRNRQALEQAMQDSVPPAQPNEPQA